MADAAERAGVDDKLTSAGKLLIHYGLALVVVWVGALKFTSYEAAAIEPLVTSSPLLSWAYDIFSARTFANLLGVFEISAGVLIAARPLSAKASAVGSAAAVLLFLVTLSFLFSTPGVWEPSVGFPALSVLPGQFLAKDVMLLGAAVWSLGESLRSRKERLGSASVRE